MAHQRLKAYAATFGIPSSTVVRKAAEFSRMLDTKGSAYHKQLGLVGDAKLFMCLDLAASHSALSFDQKLLINASGMNKKNYQAALRSIQTLLSVNKQSSVTECAVTLGHPEFASATAALVKRYLHRHLGGDTSLVTPAVNLAALSVISKQNGVSLSAAKVIGMAACKKTSLEKLKTQMEQLVASGQQQTSKNPDITTAPQVRSSPRKRKLAADGDVKVKEVASSPLQKDSRALNALPLDTDSYDVWKKKIIANARSRLQK